MLAQIQTVSKPIPMLTFTCLQAYLLLVICKFLSLSTYLHICRIFGHLFGAPLSLVEAVCATSPPTGFREKETGGGGRHVVA